MLIFSSLILSNTILMTTYYILKGVIKPFPPPQYNHMTKSRAY